jgi:hypothetical protein
MPALRRPALSDARDGGDEHPQKGPVSRIGAVETDRVLHAASLPPSKKVPGVQRGAVGAALDPHVSASNAQLAFRSSSDARDASTIPLRRCGDDEVDRVVAVLSSIALRRVRLAFQHE